MKNLQAHSVSAFNAIILVSLGLWGYFSSDTPSPTALIPVLIGGILLGMNRGIKSHNKVVAHIAVLLTLLILLGLFKPLMGAIKRESTEGIIRVGVMLISTVLAMVFFIRSFIEARRNKNE